LHSRFGSDNATEIQKTCAPEGFLGTDNRDKIPEFSAMFSDEFEKPPHPCPHFLEKTSL